MNSKLSEILEKIPEAAKDIRLTFKNISENSVIKEQVSLLGLAAAINLKNENLIAAFGENLDETQKNAAISAAALMNMTNVYYGFTEIIEEIKTAPTGIRMQAYANNGGVDKMTWEKLTLIVSIINKCKGCMKSHAEALKNGGESIETIKDIGRLAAVVHAIHKFS